MGIRKKKNCKKKLRECQPGQEAKPVSIYRVEAEWRGQGLEKFCIRKPAYIHSTESQAKDIILQKDVETTSDITRLLGRRACIICSVGES